MDKFNPDANNTPNAVGTQEPHSGVHNNEFPVREYKDTSLDEAVKLPEFKSEFPTGEVVTVASFTGQSPETVEVIEPSEAASKTQAEAPKKGMSKAAKIAMGIVGGVAAVGVTVPLVLGLTSQGREGDNGTPPEDNPKDTTQVEPGTDGEEKPPVIEEEPATPESPLEQAFNLPKPEKFESLDSMSLEEFNQQPIEDRVAYGMWLNRDSKQLAEEWFEASENPRDQLPINTVVGPENTGEEIIANARSLQRGAITNHFNEFGIEKSPLYENLQREKMISASFLYAGGPGAENWRESARNEKINGFAPDFYIQNNMLLADEEVVSRSETYTYTDQAGIERKAVDIVTRESDGSENKNTLVLVQTQAGSQWVVEKGI